VGHRIDNPILVKAALKRPVPYTPVWLMRQAGRYLKEYRELRERYTFWELCKNPELIARITLLPIRKFNLDGAILFSDLLLPLVELGFEVFMDDEGPKLLTPLQRPDELERLESRRLLERIGYLKEAVVALKQELSPKVALIGFAGAPFTLACYLIEGKGGSFLKVKEFMRKQPKVFATLMEKLSEVVLEFLKVQVEAGCDLVQVFDSWAGVLSPYEYGRYVMPFSRKVLEGVGVPVVHFSTCTAGYVELIAEAGGEVIGLDWRVDLAQAWQRLGYRKAIQGNLDPSVLLGPKEVIRRETEQILSSVRGRPGHIFNLGHGVLPQTPEDNVAYVVDLVHSLTEAKG